jgi:hypothetical protein
LMGVHDAVGLAIGGNSEKHLPALEIVGS